MADNEENEFLDLQETYALPEKKEIALDLENKKTLDLSSLTPLEMIQLTAQEHGIELKQFPLKKKNNFKFDTGCRRSGCYGRGYKGWDGIVPVPCVCLFKPENRNDGKNAINRQANRRFERMVQLQIRNTLEHRAEVYGLKQKNKDIWVSKNGTEFRWMNVKGKWDFRRADIVLEPTVINLDGE